MRHLIPQPEAERTLNEKIIEWEREVNNLLGVAKLSTEKRLELEALLRLSADPDSYLTSSTYYFFTGRNGLWHYSSNSGDVLFCWHPNRSGHIIVFPPANKHEYLAINDLLQNIPQPPDGISIARVKAKEEISDILCALKESKRSLELTPVRETVLDWTYPVRILSTDLVKRTAGNKFRNVRKGLIHMRAHVVRRENLDIRIHAKDLASLLQRWASLISSTQQEYDDLYETYDRLFSLSSEASPSVKGVIYYVNEIVEAVSLWDVSGGEKPRANLYANFGNINIEGLAEYTIVSLCELLSSEGIELLSLGGSELPSLDFFKSKFRPVISIDLVSVKVKLGEMIGVARSSDKQKETIYVQA